MRKALALLAVVGAFMFFAAGVASAQEDPQYPGTTTTEATATTTTVPTTTTNDGVGGAGEGTGGAGGAGGGQLPATGSDSLPLTQMAIVLVASGGIALMAVRRQTLARVNANS